MNTTEMQRLARAVASLRPDWSQSSVLKLLQRSELGSRPWHDVGLALTWVALDLESRTPGRVLEDGPWWSAPMGRTQRPRCETHPGQPAGLACPLCAAGRNAENRREAELAEQRRRDGAQAAPSGVAQMRADLAATRSRGEQLQRKRDQQAAVQREAREHARIQLHPGPTETEVHAEPGR